MITNNRLNFIVIVVGVTIILGIISVSVISFINLWEKEVISTHGTMTQIIAQQLHQYSETVIEDPPFRSVFDNQTMDEETIDQIDSILQTLSNIVLSEIKGLEGGFYLDTFDEFVGYAYPTLPPPKPAYGPPPRSHDIIKDQVIQSIAENSEILKLHEFDPAVFTLTTTPIHIDDRVVGAVWVRIHIERKLPAYRIREILNIIVLVAVTGFVVAVIIFMSLQKRTRDIRHGLESIQEDPSYRFNIQGGTYGFIADSINSLVNNLELEHLRLQRLEKEMHQQDKLASLGKLIAGVAHEVKTPLAIIKTRVQLWQQQSSRSGDVVEPVSLESMELVVQEINRLTELVNRLLVFSKPIKKDLSQQSLNSLIAETIQLLKVDYEQMVFQENYDENLPPIFVDPQAIKQVLINVLSNSAQANSEKGTIAISTRLSPMRTSLLIRIHDNGPGITDEMLDKIFDPFFTTKEQGAGLGLSISYEIIKAHDGKIKFINEPTGGLTCEIELPTIQG